MSAEAALDKMRLLALLVLGSKAKGSAVPFADIQAALDIPCEQVRRGRLGLLARAEFGRLTLLVFGRISLLGCSAAAC